MAIGDQIPTFCLKGKVPVIVVGCKLDLAYEQYPMSREQVISPIWLQYREIEAFIECSAANLAQPIYTHLDIFFHPNNSDHKFAVGAAAAMIALAAYRAYASWKSYSGG
ncbi:hypothetical protein Tco_0149720 [Tanacetum coccineum]